MVSTRGHKPSLNSPAKEKPNVPRTRRVHSIDRGDQGADAGEEEQIILSRPRGNRRALATSALVDEDSSASKRQKQSSGTSDVISSKSRVSSKPGTRSGRLDLKTVTAGNPDASLLDKGSTVTDQTTLGSIEGELSTTIMHREDGRKLQTFPLFHKYKYFLSREMPSRLKGMNEAVIWNIIENCEKVDELIQLGESFSNKVDTDGLPTLGAENIYQAEALPVLESLSVQILHVFAIYGIQDLLNIVSDSSSDVGATYAVLKHLFDDTKKLYPSKDAFLSISELGSHGSKAVAVMRTANLATFVTSCFGSREIGFYHLHEYFLSTFANDGTRLLKQPAGLFLDLKTQTYVSAMSAKHQPKSVILDEMFPENMEQQLKDRRMVIKSLAPSEIEFIERIKNRRKVLEEEPDTDEALESLKDRYRWDGFLTELTNYVHKSFEATVGVQLSEIPPLDENSIHDPREESGFSGQEPSVQLPNRISARGLSDDIAAPGSHVTRPLPDQFPAPPSSRTQRHFAAANDNRGVSTTTSEDIAAKAALAAQEAVQGYHPRMRDIVNTIPGYPHSSPSPYGMFPHSFQGVSSSPAHPRNRLGTQYPPSYSGTPSAPSKPGSLQNPTRNGKRTATRQSARSELPIFQHQFDSGQGRSQTDFSPSSSAPRNSQNLLMPPAGYTSLAMPHPQQSAPTAELYERARQASSSKSFPSTKARSSNGNSNRRPWTEGEEKALMAGLDRVKGPHWSQILALYGPGGTISEELQSRSQVQLKDKARNLKLFFLKSKIEVPYYLKCVTGELKSRAPNHVAADEIAQDADAQHPGNTDFSPPVPASDHIATSMGGHRSTALQAPPQQTPAPSSQGNDSNLDPAMTLNGPNTSSEAAIASKRDLEESQSHFHRTSDNSRNSDQHDANLANSAAEEAAQAIAALRKSK